MLSATWTIEAAQDLNSQFICEEGRILQEIADDVGVEALGPRLGKRLKELSLDIEAELTSALSAEIAKEIDRDIIAQIMGEPQNESLHL